MPESLNKVQKVLVRLIRNQLPSQAREVIRQLHAADLGDLLHYFTKANKEAFIKLLIETDAIAEVLAELDEDRFNEVREFIPEEKLVRLLQTIPTDDAADIINYLPEEERERIFRKLTGKQKRFVGQLLGYEEDTAGGIMTTELHSFSEEMTVEEAIEKLRHEEKKEVVLSIYVVSSHDNLVGVAPFKSLVFASPKQTLADIMERDPVCVRVDEPREQAANLIAQYDLLSLPVVDETGVLQGVITVDDAIDVMWDEATEDMFRLANLDAEEQVHSSVSKSLRMRLPWMLFNLFTVTFVALTVSFFQNTIEKFVAITILMPVIAGMGGNAGTQSLTVVVRGLALGEIEFKQGLKLLFKQFRVGLIAGIVIGIVVGTISYFFFNNPYLGFIGFGALLMNMTLACLIGSIVPLTLRKLHLDPALGSSIFVTMITDIGGYLFLFGLATLLMPWLQNVD